MLPFVVIQVRWDFIVRTNKVMVDFLMTGVLIFEFVVDFLKTDVLIFEFVQREVARDFDLSCCYSITVFVWLLCGYRYESIWINIRTIWSNIKSINMLIKYSYIKYVLVTQIENACHAQKNSVPVIVRYPWLGGAGCVEKYAGWYGWVLAEIWPILLASWRLFKHRASFDESGFLALGNKKITLAVC